MLDSRFPTLKRLSEAGLLAADIATIREVERRTNTTAIVNTAGRGRVIFRYGENLGGPLGVSLDDIRRPGWSVEDAVRYIQMGRLSPAEKDAIARDNEVRQKSERQSFEDRVLDSATKNAQDYVAHNDRARRGVEKVVLATA